MSSSSNSSTDTVFSTGPSSSWVKVSPTSDFPIQNIPFGIASIVNDSASIPRPVSALGDYVIDLAVLAKNGLFNDETIQKALQQPTLNSFMNLGRTSWLKVRHLLQNYFADTNYPSFNNTVYNNEELKQQVLIPLASVRMHLPAHIGDYTDFYSSRDHAYNVGVMIRGPANAMQPNWTWLPVGYHGRSSSVVVSGTDFKRPCGQTQADPADANKGAIYGPSKRMDFELEMGTWIGPGNALGESIPITNANDHIFGMCLMNDWSARDIQTWEYVPLGPFGSKNFCTTVSPWIITLEALEPFVCSTSSGVQDPVPLPYLQDPHYSSYDVNLEVTLLPKDGTESVLSNSNYKHMYWNLRQQLVHHTVTGCNMRPGDLLGSGTISGPTPDSRGCLLELTWKGEKPISLSNGEQRVFLKDFDTIIMRGYCEKSGVRIGFGECRGMVLPATPLV